MISVRPGIVVFVVVALLFARMAGTHLHLCFDGLEPPTSVQSQMYDLGDGYIHNTTSSEVPRQDIDIDLVGELLTKLAKISPDFPVLIIAVALFLLSPRPLPSYGRAIAASFVSNSWPRIRPPLRAPPR